MSKFVNFTSIEFNTMEELRKTLDSLVAQRDALEIEASALRDDLMSPGLNGEPPAGIKDPLVDAEGFPRADIDIYAVKGKRKRLAEINYDHKLIMKQIEELLPRLYASAPPPLPSIETKKQTPQTTVSDPITSTKHVKAIAEIDEVSDNSPAFEGGLRVKDRIVKFGPVTSLTSGALQAIAKTVGDNVNKPIPITVLRGEDIVDIEITPKAWGGRGLLGCHLMPI